MKQHIQSTLRGALIAAGVLAGASAWAITPGAASNDLQAPPTKPSASMTQGSDYGNAADKRTDTNKVQPSREAVQERANQPSTSVLDDNAQRQHDRDQGSTQRPSEDTAGTTHQGPSSMDSGSASPSSGSSMNGTRPSSGSGMSSSSGADTGSTITTRDWDKIDSNHDGSVSPQEMDSWLQNNRAQQGSTQQSAPEK